MQQHSTNTIFLNDWKYTCLCVLVAGATWYFILLVTSFFCLMIKDFQTECLFSIPIISTFSLCLLFQATKKKITQFLLHEINGSHLIGHDVHLLISLVYSLNLSYLSYCVFLTELLLYCGWALCFINRVIIYSIVQTGTLLKIKGSALTSINCTVWSPYLQAV